MTTKTAERTINDKQVKIVLLGAIKGIKISTQLSKVVFPAIAAVQEGRGDFKDLIQSAISSLEEVDLSNIIKELFDGATVDEFPIKPDDYFAGNYGELLDFMAFALEANFGSFFESKLLKGQITTGPKKSK